MKMKFPFIFVLLVSLFSFACAEIVFAKTDLSISESDITFSKNEPLEGAPVRIYARVTNSGDTDASGFVIFFDNGKQISEPQPISVKTGSYDDVFVDWSAQSGKHNIKANISGLNPLDETNENNSAIKNDVYVDLDTDKDGVGDSKDEDADNDGISNSQESSSGTNPLIADTDSDGINDKVDAFPRDASETRDTDGDGLGDEKDLDDDGDGIFDFEETHEYGTNPLNADSDSDGLNDKQEADKKTDPLKADTDGDNTNDLKDAYPLDKTKFSASVTDSITNFLRSDNAIYFIFGVPVALIILFLLFRRKRRR